MKLSVAIAIVVLALAAAAAYFIFRGEPQPLKIGGDGFPISDSAIKNPPSADDNAAENDNSGAPQTIKEQINDEITKFVEEGIPSLVVEDKPYGADTYQNSIVPHDTETESETRKIYYPTQPSQPYFNSGAQPAAATSVGGTVKAPQIVLTESEKVAALYPQYYLDQLSYLQDLMISEGILTERLQFKTLAEVQEFNRNALEYAIAEGIVTPEDGQNFLNGLNVELPKLQEFELQIYIEQQQQPTSKADEPLAFGVCGADEQPLTLDYTTVSWITRVGSAISSALTVLGIAPTAEAIALSPDCFKDNGGIPGPPGTDFITPCCNCCIRRGRRCVPVGCLNTCPGNAIWDAATGICGCG